ncbi:cysteine--tRNA ligase [Bradyrhizobium guangdongense]|uniref:Cysteine--tRNA ligase n=1 Tax=Bradyrhizobium guangdongense TaxID=1325090 RepID=A0AA87W2P4_9BRAD|nr:cysteine--tRNA ligase [Bradyrhizobium guangdongense]GGI22442.1 cysteine--tRNA ligase [Bradyrhizobium guangdongense]
MELHLYDTLSREKRRFEPIDPANVRMYVCGPTVYDFAHIGNARPVIVFDVLFRLLRHIYGEKHVTYVRNITDVDDKINARALHDYPNLPLNDAIRKVTETTASQFQADAEALGCLAPTHQPRATEFVLPRSDGRADMKSLVQELLDRDHAYLTLGNEGREILFDVSSMSDYGALSKRKLEEQIPGARVAVDSHKMNAEDFVLWKESGSRDPGWQGEFRPNPKSGYYTEFRISPENAARLQLNSPVVAIHGRPGWHIECSAMSAAYLGEIFDIHGGGLDLIFPHHENEIAQSRCAHGTRAMANFWMHNGFLQVEGEKMSKSLGNFFTIHELLEGRSFGNRSWDGPVLRLAMLMTHYRQPIDWTVARLKAADDLLTSWMRLVADLPVTDLHTPPSPQLIEALADDLNSAEAIQLISHLAKSADSQVKRTELLGNLVFMGLVPDPARSAEIFDKAIGLFASLQSKHAENMRKLSADYEERSKYAGPGVKLGDLSSTKRTLEDFRTLNELIERRLAARSRKDFLESDRLRGEALAMGFVLKDSKGTQGEPLTTWEVAR